MVEYEFKKITMVPTVKDFTDVVLSRRKQQTPLVVSKGCSFIRIRQFHMRKVKIVQQNFHEKLTDIIEEFPLSDDINSFYGGHLPVLSNKDPYKLALGQVYTARRLISKIANGYVKLLKSSDSLYQCKSLKVVAHGRMCTVIKRIGPSLAYLKQIRKHMTTIFMSCRHPDVGKSSFINNDEWIDDVLPEILDGHDVYDLIDQDILSRLEELEREGGMRLAGEADDEFKIDGKELIPKEQEAFDKSMLIQQHRIMKKSTAQSQPVVSRKYHFGCFPWLWCFCYFLCYPFGEKVSHST